MFTGIVEDVGTVLGRRGDPLGAELAIAPTRLDAGQLEPGESLAVDGVCLTVTDRRGPDRPGGGGEVRVFASAETLARTTLAGLAPGDRVNLERALRLADRLGGHLVLGHVDGVGTIEAVRPEGETLRVTVRVPRELARYLVVKGSVAIDGVSLTVNELDDRPEGTLAGFVLIPFTRDRTALGSKKPGARVNIEADIIAKHLERLAFFRDA
ncbi:MAG TPA: riboflavin synthase [Thermodesulfobacteriota bacterium]|nr:riboflavin synthase [Thermodesulfobacteriota bacterium]